MSSPPFWLLIFLVVPFNKIPVFSKELVTFIISFASMFVSVIPEPFSLTLLSTFFTPTYIIFFEKFMIDSNKDPPNCISLDSWVFGNFILAYEPFAKALLSLETCASVNNNLCGNLFSWFESPFTFDKRFKVTSVPYFISDYFLF